MHVVITKENALRRRGELFPGLQMDFEAWWDRLKKAGYIFPGDSWAVGDGGEHLSLHSIFDGRGDGLGKETWECFSEQLKELLIQYEDEQPYMICIECGKIVDTDDSYFIEEQASAVCRECFGKIFNECKKCGAPYVSTTVEGLCDYCAEEVRYDY